MALNFRLFGCVVVAVILLSSFGFSQAATSGETAQSYFEEGLELNKQRRFDEAIEKLTKAVRLSLETHRYHQALFMTYLATQRGLKAMEIYKGLVREFPKSSAVRYWLGRLYLQSRALDDAAREFREAARLAPKDEHAWISLGHVYYAQGKDEEATKAYLEADRLSPKVAVVHAGLGNLYLKKNDYPKARKEFSEALRIDPSLTEARYNLSLIYEKGGDVTQAMKEWRQILEDDPNESDARERLAKAYFQKRQYADAVQEYSTLTQVRQGSPDIFLALGESQILLAASLSDANDRTQLMGAAEESFRRVLELDPRNEEAKAYLNQLQSGK